MYIYLNYDFGQSDHVLTLLPNQFEIFIGTETSSIYCVFVNI